VKLPPDARLHADVEGLLEAAGESTGAGVVDAILVHLRLLARWNDAYGLTRITEWPDVLDRHVRESLLPLRWIVREQPGQLLDVGSGNGFPAIPLLACRPRLAGVLLERSERKGLFLDAVVRECGWAERVIVDPSDAESYQPGRAAEGLSRTRPLPMSAADVGEESARNRMSAADSGISAGVEQGPSIVASGAKKGARIALNARRSTGRSDMSAADKASDGTSAGALAARKTARSSKTSGSTVPASSGVALPQPDGLFDYVLSRATLAPDRFLDLAAKWVRPGGRVLLFAGDIDPLGPRGESSQAKGTARGSSRLRLLIQERIPGRRASFLHVFEASAGM
jgi:16S rRNA G527 N7-methylase RsmG